MNWEIFFSNNYFNMTGIAAITNPRLQRIHFYCGVCVFSGPHEHD